MMKLIPLSAISDLRVEQLLDQAFGPDRRERTAYKLRAGTRAVPALSFAAVEGDDLLGTIQCWPTALVASEARYPMVLVGPVAVSPIVQRGGIGKLLMQTMLSTAEKSDAPGADALMMIGDPEYYERFFGFSADRTQGWALPGPFERRRLLARVLRGGGLPQAGCVVPDPR